MSFRNRLTLFFIVIVVVPMIAVALVLFRLVSDSEQGKADARLSEAQTAASGLFQTYQERAETAAAEIGGDDRLAAAIRARDKRAVESRLEALARLARTERVRMRLDGVGTFEAGGGEVVAPARSELLDDRDKRVGELVVSVISAADFSRVAGRVTGFDVVLSSGDRVISSTLPAVRDPNLPDRGERTIAGQKYRLAGFPAPGFDGRSLTVRLLVDPNEPDSKVGTSTVLVAVALAGFLVLAFAFALTVSRSLQAQIQRLLDAAQRLGAGEFDIKVPTEGNDEFAALGTEFNAMARQLEGRLDELQRERARLSEAIRRIGESFASGLDRDEMLDIAVDTAVDGVSAECGRAAVRDEKQGRFDQVAGAGDVAARRDAINAVEAAVLESGRPAEITIGGVAAMSHPLRVDGERVVALLSVARAQNAFTQTEQEMFHYLAAQAAVAVENVDLHNTVQRQAVTDELTGLSNQRRFGEVVAAEIERSRRFGQQMGLIMLDIDDFKLVNDTYGHQQGDVVLREVAQVLRDTSREIDEPARYGGEEMAVALPQTDLEGAFLYADRLRQRIESLEVPRLDGHGTLRVTASFGVASVPDSAATDKEALVAAADAALYRAKRAGKNRVFRASHSAGTPG